MGWRPAAVNGRRCLCGRGRGCDCRFANYTAAARHCPQTRIRRHWAPGGWKRTETVTTRTNVNVGLRRTTMWGVELSARMVRSGRARWRCGRCEIGDRWATWLTRLRRFACRSSFRRSTRRTESKRLCGSAVALGPCEVLVVDGGSNDETMRLAESAGARTVPAERCRAAQQNVGAAAATGDVLLFLHADTWLPPEAGEQIRAEMADANQADTYDRSRRVSPTNRSARTVVSRIGMGKRATGAGVRFAVWRPGYFHTAGTCSTSWGGFPDVRLMEDLLLMRRARRVGRVALLPGPLHTSARRWRRYGVVLQTWRNWALLAAERLGASPDWLARFYPAHRAEAAANDAAQKARKPKKTNDGRQAG